MIHLVTFVWGILNLVLRGFLVKTFWAWFVLTQFPSLPKLEVLPAIGLVYFVSVMVPWKQVTMKDWEELRARSDEDKKLVNIINAGAQTLGTLLALGAGWIVHHFM